MAMPIQGFRVGSVKASIWANDTPSGTRYNTTFLRSYNHHGQWKTTSSYGRDDLVSLASVAEMARNWIAQQEQNDRRDG